MKMSDLKRLIQEVVQEAVSGNLSPNDLNGKTIKSAKLKNEYELELIFTDGTSLYITGQGGYDGELSLASTSMFGRPEPEVPDRGWRAKLAHK